MAVQNLVRILTKRHERKKKSSSASSNGSKLPRTIVIYKDHEFKVSAQSYQDLNCLPWHIGNKVIELANSNHLVTRYDDWMLIAKAA